MPCRQNLPDRHRSQNYFFPAQRHAFRDLERVCPFMRRGVLPEYSDCLLGCIPARSLPLIVASQTIPVITIAPLLVIWLATTQFPHHHHRAGGVFSADDQFCNRPPGNRTRVHKFFSLSQCKRNLNFYQAAFSGGTAQYFRRSKGGFHARCHRGDYRRMGGRERRPEATSWRKTPRS